MKMSRRGFLSAGLTVTSCFLLVPQQAMATSLFRSPVTTNMLRPPGAVKEDIFAGKCIRCGRCVEVCPYRSIRPLSLKYGVYAGTPMIFVTEIPCYLCMKCVEVCPTGTLLPIAKNETRMGIAVIDRMRCVTWKGELLCHTCYNVCPYKEQAIRLDEFRPVIDERVCTGCGICVHGCPISTEEGKKAINIEPIYSGTTS